MIKSVDTEEQRLLTTIAPFSGRRRRDAITLPATCRCHRATRASTAASQGQPRAAPGFTVRKQSRAGGCSLLILFFFKFSRYWVLLDACCRSGNGAKYASLPQPGKFVAAVVFLSARRLLLGAQDDGGGTGSQGVGRIFVSLEVDLSGVVDEEHSAMHVLGRISREGVRNVMEDGIVSEI